MKFILLAVLAASAIARPIVDTQDTASELTLGNGLLLPIRKLAARFLPGLGGGGGMAMPMSGMPGDPLIAISGFEDKLLGNKPHHKLARRDALKRRQGFKIPSLPLPIRKLAARFIDGLIGNVSGGGGGAPFGGMGGGTAPGGGMAMPMSGMPGDPLIAISGAEDKLLGNKPHHKLARRDTLKRRQGFKIPGLGAGMLPSAGKAPQPIDMIGPIFAVPAEGVSIVGDAINSGAGMGGGGGKMGKGLLPGMH